MQKSRLHHAGLSLIAALALGACEQGALDGNMFTAADRSEATAEVIRYECADGSVVKARYPAADRAEISHDGQVIEMRIAISGSGARYIGDGWEWWTKGMSEGTLTPLAAGEEVASADGVFCTAE
ncbi:MAG TPA: MliC family protein [Paracoccaceae bacterium]|nr:MliC family protein [Paracoccaceae bacterium]